MFGFSAKMTAIAGRVRGLEKFLKAKIRVQHYNTFLP
jgi:hypothetical protein